MKKILLILFYTVLSSAHMRRETETPMGMIMLMPTANSPTAHNEATIARLQAEMASGS